MAWRWPPSWSTAWPTGSTARWRHTALTDFGGYLDIVCDFIVMPASLGWPHGR
jgi:hypothetical protein